MDEADQNDPEQMYDEEDVDQYEQEEMDDEEDDELANLPGEGKQNIGLIELERYFDILFLIIHSRRNSEEAVFIQRKNFSH